MTFHQFCQTHQVNRQEWAELNLYLCFLRFRELFRWWQTRV